MTDAAEMPKASVRKPAPSLRDSLRIMVQERFLAYLTTTLFLVLAAILEWLRALFALPPAPWIWTGMAAVAVVLCAIKYRLLHREMRVRDANGA